MPNNQHQPNNVCSVQLCVCTHCFVCTRWRTLASEQQTIQLGLFCFLQSEFLAVCRPLRRIGRREQMSSGINFHQVAQTRFSGEDHLVSSQPFSACLMKIHIFYTILSISSSLPESERTKSSCRVWVSMSLSIRGARSSVTLRGSGEVEGTDACHRKLCAVLVTHKKSRNITETVRFTG